MSVARKRKLPKADDFFGGAAPVAVDEPLAKTVEEKPAAEGDDVAVRLTEEAIAESRRRVRELEERGEGDDEQVAAMIEAANKAEKAVERLRAVEEAVRYKPRIVPPGVTEKVTFYLPLEQLKRLEAVKLEFLLEHNLKITRSQIIEALVQRMEEQIGEIVQYLEAQAE